MVALETIRRLPRVCAMMPPANKYASDLPTPVGPSITAMLSPCRSGASPPSSRVSVREKALAMAAIISRWAGRGRKWGRFSEMAR